jgi:hypothetical protein
MCERLHALSSPNRPLSKLSTSARLRVLSTSGAARLVDNFSRRILGELASKPSLLYYRPAWRTMSGSVDAVPHPTTTSPAMLFSLAAPLPRGHCVYAELSAVRVVG